MSWIWWQKYDSFGQVNRSSCRFRFAFHLRHCRHLFRNGDGFGSMLGASRNDDVDDLVLSMRTSLLYFPLRDVAQRPFFRQKVRSGETSSTDDLVSAPLSLSGKTTLSDASARVGHFEFFRWNSFNGCAISRRALRVLQADTPKGRVNSCRPHRVP